MIATITGGNELSFASDPGLYTGEPVTYHANGGGGIAGLTSGTTYYVISVDDTHIQLDPSFIDATSKSPTDIIKLTTPAGAATGTGTFVMGTASAHRRATSRPILIARP